VAVLKQAQLGVPVSEMIRKIGISEQIFYRWTKQHVGIGDPPDASDEIASGGEWRVEAVSYRPEPGYHDASVCAQKVF
jgi:transposase-like protein